MTHFDDHLTIDIDGEVKLPEGFHLTTVEDLEMEVVDRLNMENDIEKMLLEHDSQVDTQEMVEMEYDISGRSWQEQAEWSLTG